MLYVILYLLGTIISAGLIYIDITYCDPFEDNRNILKETLIVFLLFIFMFLFWVFVIPIYLLVNLIRYLNRRIH